MKQGRNNDMTSEAGFPELRRDKSDMAAVGVRVDETYWGYVLRAEYRNRRFEFATRARAVFPGIALILAAGLWAWLAAFSPGGTIALRVAAFSVIVGVGLIVFWRIWGQKQARPEFHFDQSRQELRCVVRDFRGRARLIARHNFSDIEEVYAESAPEDGGTGQLLLRPENGEEIIVAACAPEHQLDALRRRIARDLRRSRRIKPAWFSQQKTPVTERQDALRQAAARLDNYAEVFIVISCSGVFT